MTSHPGLALSQLDLRGSYPGDTQLTAAEWAERTAAAPDEAQILRPLAPRIRWDFGVSFRHTFSKLGLDFEAGIELPGGDFSRRRAADGGRSPGHDPAGFEVPFRYTFPESGRMVETRGNRLPKEWVEPPSSGPPGWRRFAESPWHQIERLPPAERIEEDGDFGL